MSVYDHVSGRLSELDKEVVRHVPPGGNWRNLPPDFNSRRIDQIRRSAAAGEGSRSTYYGRLRADRSAYTISTYFNRPGNGCFIHPEAPRLISVREAARLQTFPDSYRFEGQGRARFVQVGNAVPPVLAYHIAQVLPKGRFADLFAGAGGLSLGFEWAGHQLVAAVDNDAAAAKTLLANGVPPGRVHALDLSSDDGIGRVVEALTKQSRQLDLLIGGPPCQGFSTAGKNLDADPRNRLVHAFLRVVEEIRPRRILMENVPALMFRRRKPVLRAILARLGELGYLTSTAVLHAEAYGVPQLRRRLFIAGTQEGEVVWPAPSFEVLDPAQRSFQPGPSGGPAGVQVRTVADAIGDLPAETAGDPDIALPYGSSPRTRLQEWARGVIPIDRLVPPVSAAAAPDELSLAA